MSYDIMSLSKITTSNLKKEVRKLMAKYNLGSFILAGGGKEINNCQIKRATAKAQQMETAQIAEQRGIQTKALIRQQENREITERLSAGFDAMRGRIRSEAHRIVEEAHRTVEQVWREGDYETHRMRREADLESLARQLDPGLRIVTNYVIDRELDKIYGDDPKIIDGTCTHAR